LKLPIDIHFRPAPSPAEKLLRANRVAEAEEAFAAEAAAQPRNPFPALALGHIALMHDDLERAAGFLTDAVTRDPRCRDAHELLAETHYRRDDFQAAAPHEEAAGNGAVAAKLRSFAGRRPYTLEGPDVVRLPFVRSEPLPILVARVNGGPEARFLLDTGGGEVILDRAFAQSIGVPLFGGKRQGFAGGKLAGVGQGAIESIALGELTVRDVPVNIVDVAALGASIGEPALAGIIGTVLLYRFLATIDYPAGALVLRRKGTTGPKAAPGAVEIPLLLADDHYVLAEATLNDATPLLCFLDTGLAGGAFTCPESTVKEAGIVFGNKPRDTGLGGGGKISFKLFDVASLAVGKARRENLQGFLGPFPPALEHEYGVRIGGLVSHGYLCAYAVTFDFARMILRLEPA
jgi:hypothetical protein